MLVMKDNFMMGAVIITIAAIVGFAAHFITKTPDSPVEEAAEAVIEYELGLPKGTIDLSKEKK